MYNKEMQQETLLLLRQMNEKLDHLCGIRAARPTQTSAVNAAPEPSPHMMWNLTQSQYELSKELSDGIQKLRQIILAGEKYATQARGRYQK